MRSVLAGLRQLVLPWGAPASSPHIVLGPDIPATLTAATTDFTWTAAIVQYFDATSYAFQAIGYYNLPTPQFDRVVASGTYDPVNGVLLSEEQHEGALQIFYGSDVYNSALTEWQWQKGNLKITSTAGLSIDGVTAARGLKAWDASITPVAAFSTDTQMNKLTAAVLKAGQCYEFRWTNVFASSAAPQEIQSHLWLNAIGGTNRAEWYLQQSSTGWTSREGTVKIKNSTGADETADVILSAVPTTGTVQCPNGPQRVRSLGMWHIGAAADYPNVIEF